MASKAAIKFHIELNSKREVYTPGTTVEGSIVLEASKMEKIRDMKIVFSGEARTFWTVVVSNHTSSTIYLYSDTEVFFRTMRVLRSSDDDECGQVLTAGVHKFPFEFQLPTDGCPSSFQSEALGEGSIRYWLTATISQPTSTATSTVERDIIVNEIVDINLPHLIQPLSSSNEKTVCCLWCASGPISLSVTTDRRGYSTGESIAISIKAKNSSRRRVSVVRASLKQKATLYAKGRTYACSQPAERVEEKLIQRIERPGIEPGSTCTWVNEPLIIPLTTTPTISSCRIVKLSYTLTVTLAIPYAKDLHVKIPITVGNVPYDQQMYNDSSYKKTPM